MRFIFCQSIAIATKKKPLLTFQLRPYIRSSSGDHLKGSRSSLFKLNISSETSDQPFPAGLISSLLLVSKTRFAYSDNLAFLLPGKESRS